MIQHIASTIRQRRRNRRRAHLAHLAHLRARRELGRARFAGAVAEDATERRLREMRYLHHAGRARRLAVA